MATHDARTDLDFDEFRTLLRSYQSQLNTLRQKQRTGTLGKVGDAGNESAYSTTDVSENGDTAAILADLDREFPAEENVIETLKEIDGAVDRLNAGAYGLDVVTGEPIPIARLRAIPWAAMTVETAERVQR